MSPFAMSITSWRISVSVFLVIVDSHRELDDPHSTISLRHDASTRIEAYEQLWCYGGSVQLEIEAWVRNRISLPPLS
jgi:hypothetical protein